MTVKEFKQLFVHRSDAYAEQRDIDGKFPTGGYNSVKQELTDEIIQKHLDGEITIGIYNIKPGEHTIKWACIDIDITKEKVIEPGFKFEDWEPRILEQAQIIKDLLLENTIFSYLEFSGKRGYHVWIFFEMPISAKFVQDILKKILATAKKVDTKYIDWEIYPKQTQVTDTSYGSLVKGPCGIHRYSGKRSVFIDFTGIDKIKFVTKLQLEANLQEKGRWNVIRRCKYISEKWDECIESGVANNDFRCILGYLYTTIPNGFKFLTDNFFSKLKNYDSEKTYDSLEEMDKKNYLPCLCTTIQSKGICKDQCQEIQKAKSPSAFYYWEIKAPEVSAESQLETSIFDELEIINGNYIYKKIDAKGNILRRKITNFYINIKKKINSISNGIVVSKIEGEFIMPNFRKDFITETATLSNKEKLGRLMNEIGFGFNLLNERPDLLSHCISKYAIDVQQVDISEDFGWTTDKNSFITPSLVVEKDGITPNTKTVMKFTDNYANGLDFSIINENEKDIVAENILSNFYQLFQDSGTSAAVLATIALPIVFPFVTACREKPAIWFWGISGAGKSFVINLMSSFYGDFPSLISWNSTPNAIEDTGYWFKNALYCVDDYKGDPKNSQHDIQLKLKLIQCYADGTARSRLSQNAVKKAERPIRGIMLSSGEDLIQHQASTMARIIPISFNNNNTKNLKLGRELKDQKYLYPGILPYFIKYLLQLNNPEIIINGQFSYLHDKYYGLVAGRSNDSRISGNVAHLATSFYFFIKFLLQDDKTEANIKFNDFDTYCEKLVLNAIAMSDEQRPSEQFLNTLKDLLTTQKVKIAPKNKFDQTRYNTTCIGYMDVVDEEFPDIKEPVPHLLKSIAYDEVRDRCSKSGKELTHSMKAVVAELYNRDLVLDPPEPDIFRRVNGQNQRILRFKPGVIN